MEVVPGEPVGGVKRKRRSKIERRHVRVSLMAFSTLVLKLSFSQSLSSP